jgi:cell wall-associated NlpC family hydrolase
VASPTETAEPRTKKKPTTTPTPEETPEPNPTASPEPKATISQSTSPEKKGGHAANATISANEIAGYEGYPANVRKVLDLGLGLTTQNLGYKYGSADPTNGGMDCSGFIYYVLSKSGIKDPPRDAREQYIWVRKAGNFQAVLGHGDDTFELEGLKPGDLLFWTGTYSVTRDPDITHTMIYLGREKATNRRIMVGASDGRTYNGQSRFGVSIFDFKVARSAPKSDNRPGPVFVGYGRIPNLPEE